MMQRRCRVMLRFYAFSIADAGWLKSTFLCHRGRRRNQGSAHQPLPQTIGFRDVIGHPIITL